MRPEQDDPAIAHLKRLFSYNWALRSALLDALGQLPWGKITRSPRDGYRAPRDAFLDLLEIEAYWAHHVVDGRADGWEPYDRSDATSVERLALHASGAERATAERLKRLTRDALGEAVDAGDEGKTTRGDAFLRGAAVSLAEAGVLAGRLRELGVPVRVPEWGSTESG